MLPLELTGWHTHWPECPLPPASGNHKAIMMWKEGTGWPLIHSSMCLFKNIYFTPILCQTQKQRFAFHLCLIPKNLFLWFLQIRKSRPRVGRICLMLHSREGWLGSRTPVSTPSTALPMEPKSQPCRAAPANIQHWVLPSTHWWQGAASSSRPQVLLLRSLRSFGIAKSGSGLRTSACCPSWFLLPSIDVHPGWPCLLPCHVPNPLPPVPLWGPGL